MRYVSELLLPVIGGDDRFCLVLPEHWRQAPEHPLLARARHPDGYGLMPQRILGKEIHWTPSDDEPGIQVADIVAWAVARAISRPDELIARECFELLRPVPAGEAGRCFKLFLNRAGPAETEVDTPTYTGASPRMGGYIHCRTAHDMHPGPGGACEQMYLSSGSPIPINPPDTADPAKATNPTKPPNGALCSFA